MNENDFTKRFDWNANKNEGKKAKMGRVWATAFDSAQRSLLSNQKIRICSVAKPE
jgi:hypothetical protein